MKSSRILKELNKWLTITRLTLTHCLPILKYKIILLRCFWHTTFRLQGDSWQKVSSKKFLILRKSLQCISLVFQTFSLETIRFYTEWSSRALGQRPIFNFKLSESPAWPGDENIEHKDHVPGKRINFMLTNSIRWFWPWRNFWRIDLTLNAEYVKN